MWWKKHSDERAWSPDQARLPHAKRDGNLIHIENIRACRYRTAEDYDALWRRQTFDLQTLKRIWFILEPFGRSRGPAHTLASFEFEGGDFVAISPEIRKKTGERFSALKGCLGHFELMYVIGDERDLIGLRANYRRDRVYAYPVKAPRSFVQAYFLAMLERANILRKRPEFYNTVFNNCATNLRAHANAVVPGAIPWSLHTLLPRDADRFLARLGYIDDPLPIEELRPKYQINERAARFADAADFSKKIRELE